MTFVSGVNRTYLNAVDTGQNGADTGSGAVDTGQNGADTGSGAVDTGQNGADTGLSSVVTGTDAVGTGSSNATALAFMVGALAIMRMFEITLGTRSKRRKQVTEIKGGI
jgi:uncharacterized phage infection (PIP) family protein YhgE